MSDLELYHYGTPRHSGRYPWGSGDNPRQGTAAYYTGKIKTARQTGRYPQLSNKNPERYKNFKKKYEETKNKLSSHGINPTQKRIADEMGVSVDRLRALISIESNERRKEFYDQYTKLKDSGITNRSELARQLGLGAKGESRLRYLEDTKQNYIDPVQETADFLRKQVAEKGMVDVSKGANLSIYLDKNTDKPISSSRLGIALEVLKDEGYSVKNVQIDGSDKNHKTTMTVLAPPGMTYKDIDANKYDVKPIENYISDPNAVGETTKLGVPRVHSIDSDRVKIVYQEEGGKDKDGLIELRPGVADLSLGSAEYAQVRIGVDDKYYMKGMAVYADPDTMPPGVDVLYYSKKNKDVPKEKVFKEMAKTNDGQIDFENPFKTAIKTTDDLKRVPRYYTDENGKQQVSPINVINEEGDWTEWSKTISAQMLSKQPLELVKMQLTKTMDNRRAEFAEICSIDNPVVKRELLKTFASDCDSTSVHLKAMGFPEQRYHVLLPLTDIAEDKVYAPNYKDGTRVALIRYPHGGTFEIPILTVDNSNPRHQKMIGAQAPDAIGLHPTASAQLSGADNDGDTAMVIPLKGDVNIHAKRYLDELKNFDHMELYSISPADRAFKDDYNKKRDSGMNVTQIANELGMTPKELRAKINSIPDKITEPNKQKQMGITTNLIMDMTVLKAPDHDLALATKHSMVIIDALKHDLDYRQSEKDNEIARLKETYQIQPDGTIGGASTLITKAKSRQDADTYREKWDPETGKIIREDRKQDWMFFRDTGEYKHKQFKSTKMAETDDPYTLVSSYNMPIERAYAEYATQLKSLANEARKEYMATETPARDPAAAKAYAKEVASLNAQLLLFKKNKPRERQAVLLADKRVKEEIAKYEDLADDEKKIKKIRAKALNKARLEVGSDRPTITFSDKEWEAVQARAISPSMLEDLLEAADLSKVRERATPRSNYGISDAKKAAIKSLAAQGKSQAYIAEVLDISTSSVNKVLN